MYWKAAVLYLESTSGIVWQAELGGAAGRVYLLY